MTKFAPDTPHSFLEFLQRVDENNCLDSLLLVRDRLENLYFYSASIERINALIKARRRSVTLMRKITSPRYFNQKYFRNADLDGRLEGPKIFLSTFITSKGNLRLSWRPVPGHEHAWDHPDKLSDAPARLDELAIIHKFSPLMLDKDQYDLDSIHGLAQSWITAASLEFISNLAVDASWACEIITHTNRIATVREPGGMITSWSTVYPGDVPEKMEGQH